VRDYRDLVIETLSDSEAELRARIVDLEFDRAAYREISIVAIGALRGMTLERDRLRDRLQHLVEELRALRSDQRRAA
jgi:uncharacterized coiled-coil protein SlyX